MPGFRSGVAAALAVLAGCHRDHPQSMLHPASSASAEVAWLWWFLFAVCTAVFLITMMLLVAALVARPREDGEAPLGHGFIVVSGILLPAIVLVVILVVSVRSQVALQIPETRHTVRVVGHQWWWEVHYPDHQIVTANEIHIPVGEPVLIELQARDVIHSLWVPNLMGKTDLLPEKKTYTWLQANREGVFRGQCAEYCGGPHAMMGLLVIALPPDEFDAWIAERQQPPPPPDTELLQRGQQAYFRGGCHNCHAIRGTAAAGRRGPDLTHMGSRRTIGAAILPNNTGNLAGWIANPQALKPDNLMPNSHLPSDDLHALVAYLQSLQ